MAHTLFYCMYVSFSMLYQYSTVQHAQGKTKTILLHVQRRKRIIVIEYIYSPNPNPNPNLLVYKTVI